MQKSKCLVRDNQGWNSGVLPPAGFADLPQSLGSPRFHGIKRLRGQPALSHPGIGPEKPHGASVWALYRSVMACSIFAGIAAAPRQVIPRPVSFDQTRTKKLLLLEYDWGPKSCLFSHTLPHVGLENSKFLPNLQKGNQRTSIPLQPHDCLATLHQGFKNWRKQLLWSESFSSFWPALL